MKRESIDPADIRAGDLIRVEYDDERAREFRSVFDGVGFPDAPRHYLLDRPKPVVELPVEPTLGWVKTANVGAALGIWYTNDRKPRPEQLLNHKTRSQRERRDVLTFTPATAVPTDALNEFRFWWMQADVGDIADEAIGRFLDALDAANRANS